jgi:hypothetical protein
LLRVGCSVFRIPLRGRLSGSPADRKADGFSQGSLDLLTKDIVAERRAGLQAVAHPIEQGRVEAFREQQSVRALPLGVRRPQSQVLRMRGQAGILVTDCVVGIAGPGVIARRHDHRRTHRVQLDVPIAQQQVRLALNQARLEAPLPQRAAASIAMVDVRHVAPPQVLHRHKKGSDPFMARQPPSGTSSSRTASTV